ncbi:MAG: hypothetical protein U0Y10_12185 [Spirosomataceae bacterium]
MKEPRTPETIIKEIDDLIELIEHTQKTLINSPNDTLLALALKQDVFRKEKLLKELHQSLTVYFYHSA